MVCRSSSSTAEGPRPFPPDPGLATAVYAQAGEVARARIFVVEDEGIIPLDIQASLSKLGYEVVAACSSGEEAVQRAAELRPDLVLMDIRLQRAMDGVQAASHIRSSLDVPVVDMTGSAEAPYVSAFGVQATGALRNGQSGQQLHAFGKRANRPT